MRLYDEHGEKIRYLVVGVVNTGVSYVLYLVLLATLGSWLHAYDGSSSAVMSYLGHYYYLVAQWVGWVMMVPVSTLNFKYLVFRSKGDPVHEVTRAYFVYLPTQAISSLTLWFMVKALKLHPAFGQLAAVALATVFSYLGHKHFTFRQPLEAGGVPPEEPAA